MTVQNYEIFFKIIFRKCPVPDAPVSIYIAALLLDLLLFTCTARIHMQPSISIDTLLYVNTHVYICSCVCVYVHVCVCACMCARVRVCACVCASVRVHTCVRVSACVCVCVRVRVCVCDDDCFYDYKKQFSTLDRGSMRSNLGIKI